MTNLRVSPIQKEFGITFPSAHLHQVEMNDQRVFSCYGMEGMHFVLSPFGQTMYDGPRPNARNALHRALLLAMNAAEGSDDEVGAYDFQPIDTMVGRGDIARDHPMRTSVLRFPGAETLVSLFTAEQIMFNHVAVVLGENAVMLSCMPDERHEAYVNFLNSETDGLLADGQLEQNHSDTD